MSLSRRSTFPIEKVGIDGEKGRQKLRKQGDLSSKDHRYKSRSGEVSRGGGRWPRRLGLLQGVRAGRHYTLNVSRQLGLIALPAVDRPPCEPPPSVCLFTGASGSPTNASGNEICSSTSAVIYVDSKRRNAVPLAWEEGPEWAAYHGICRCLGKRIIPLFSSERALTVCYWYITLREMSLTLHWLFMLMLPGC